MSKSFFLKTVIVALLATFLFEGAILIAGAQANCPDDFRGLTEDGLKEALAVCEKEAAALEDTITNTEKEKASITRDISLLTDKIKQAKLAIKMRTLSINDITEDISVKSSTIKKLALKIERERDSLAGLIRRTDEIDSYSFAEIILSDKPLSEFFGDLDAFEYIQDSIDKSLEELGVTKQLTEEEKTALEIKKNKEADLRYQQELEKKRAEANETEKQRILKVTKGNLVAYQKDLKEKQKKAAQIRAALFALRDTEGIPFGKALEYAITAAKKTNVRPALILAILTQESELGKNIGSCLLSSIETGDGVGKNTGTLFEKVMYSRSDTMRPNDTASFENITSRLGLDWKTTQVSCPPEPRYYKGRGFGGGMGPSQFIPSTWELFKERIAEALGVRANNANPWNPEHAFTATAIYLSDLGAVSGSYTAERNSACRYYSGRKCDNKRPANSFYGSQVMRKAEEIQNNIDFLKGVNG